MKQKLYSKLVTRFLIYTVLYPFSKLPFWILYRFSDLAYLISYYGFGYRKRVVIENLTKSFPEKSTDEIQLLAKAFFKHFFDILVESFKAFTMSIEDVSRRYRFKNIEALNRFYDEGRSVCILFSHSANWEWVTIALPLVTKLQCRGIYQPLSNKTMDELVQSTRSRTGGQVVPKERVAEEVSNNAKNGVLAAYGFIGDQSPSRHGRKQWLTFLNQETACTSGYEYYAKLHNMGVVFFQAIRLRRGYYEVVVHPVTDRPKELPEGKLVEIFHSMLEGFIRQAPANWLWTHRRWKLKREST